MGTVELTLPEGGRSPEGLRVRFRVAVASTRDVPAGGGGAGAPGQVWACQGGSGRNFTVNEKLWNSIKNLE